MSDLQRFMRDHSIPALLFVVGAILIGTGICIWGGMPAALVLLGVCLIIIGSLVN